MTEIPQPQLDADRAYLALASALRAGRLRAGQFLSMPQLVGQLGHSIAAVREAVKQAASIDALRILPKRGVQVMEADPATIRACLDLRMILDQEGARRRIASGALDGLDALRASHLATRDAAAGGADPALPPQAIRTDLSLHDFLAGGLGNPLAAKTYEANRVRIAILQQARPFLHDRIRSAMEEHLAVIDALAARDAGAAEAAIRRHCLETLRWWGAV